MDLTQCSSTELTELISGYAAARKGEPMDPHATALWIEGYRFRQQIHPTSYSSATAAAE